VDDAVPPRVQYAPLAVGDFAVLDETGERVRIVEDYNQSGDFLVEDEDGQVLIVPRDELHHVGRKHAGCACCD
jgi:hypothetical protein